MSCDRESRRCRLRCHQCCQSRLPPLRNPAAAVSRGDAAQVVQRCEYSDETRAQRIAELEQMAQANVDQRWGPKSWRAVFTSNEDLRQYKQGRLGRGARQRSCNDVFGPHMRCYAIDVRFPGDTQDGFVRSMDEPCCRKGARVLALGQSLTAANMCACRHVRAGMCAVRGVG
jgi:hypothetical protein